MAGAEDLLRQQLRRLWLNHLPLLLDRVQTIEAALASPALNPELRQQAQSAAHNLAGVLGSFGLAEGTEIARKLEAAFAAEPAERTPELAAELGRLRNLIETQ